MAVVIGKRGRTAGGRRLTFDGVAEGVDAERDRDEQGEYLLGGPGGPAHEARDVEQRVEHEEEGRPQADAAVHGEEIQLEVLADAVYHCRGKARVMRQRLAALDRRRSTRKKARPVFFNAFTRQTSDL